MSIGTCLVHNLNLIRMGRKGNVNMDSCHLVRVREESVAKELLKP